MKMFKRIDLHQYVLLGEGLIVYLPERISYLFAKKKKKRRHALTCQYKKLDDLLFANGPWVSRLMEGD